MLLRDLQRENQVHSYRREKVEEKQIEKMDAETKLKMKFVFDVIDYIGDNFPVVVPDSRIAIQFDAALNLEG